MSYSVGVKTPVKAHHLPDAVRSLEPEGYSPNEFRSAVMDHIAAAGDAVAAVLKSGKFQVDEEHRYSASISGHANPGHVDKSGWSNEFMHVIINVHPAPTEE